MRGHDVAQFLGEPGGQRQRAVHLLLQPSHVRVHFDGAVGSFGDRPDHRAQRQARPRDHVGLHAREPFDDDVEPLRVAHHLPHHGDGADACQLVRRGIVGVALLHDEQEHAVAAERAVHRFDRHGAVDRERLHAQRKGHRVP